jgi:hypothetical protein
MNKNIEQWGRVFFPGLVLLVLLAGCASPQPAVTAQETATITPPTPDPLYTLHCIRQTANADLCYVSDVLAADPERLERAVKSFCLSKEEMLCSINVWKDEASVPQAIPLTDAEKASRIAFYMSNAGSGAECYQTFSIGEVVSSSSGCK